MIYFVLSNGWFIINKLGLSGGWFLEKLPRNNAVEMETTGRTFYFNDPRHYAYFKFTNDENEMNKELNSLGPDFLSDKISPNLFLERLNEKKNLKKPIYEVLADQSVFSGIGNYLRAEILYAAKINPNRKTEDIKNPLDILVIGQKIIKDAYKHHGASLQNYYDVNHNKGSFQDFLKVYDKKVDPLGNKVEKIKTKDERNVYWVPAVQTN